MFFEGKYIIFFPWERKPRMEGDRFKCMKLTHLNAIIAEWTGNPGEESRKAINCGSIYAICKLNHVYIHVFIAML